MGTAETTLGTFESVLWDSSGIFSLGHLPGNGASVNGVAEAASLSGHIIVGFDDVGGAKEAFIWDMTNGMRSIRDILENAGFDLSDWEALGTANAISADGTVIAGGVGAYFALHPNWVESSSDSLLAQLVKPLMTKYGVLGHWGAGLALGATAMACAYAAEKAIPFLASQITRIFPAKTEPSTA